MGRKSTLETLPPKVRAAAIAAMKTGATIDDLVEHLAKLGHPRSRSAVGRYAKQFSEIAKRQSDMQIVAEAFAKDFADNDNAQGKLMIQLMTSIGARLVMPIAAQDDPDIAAKDFDYLSKALKNIMASAKSDTERDEKVELRTKRKAADVAETAARKSGASAETINLVKAAILGLSS